MSLRQLLPFFILSLLVLISGNTQADAFKKIEITPLVGYRFGGDFDNNDEASINSTIKLNEKVDYGVLFAWAFDAQRQGEFLINHYSSQFSMTSLPNIQNLDIDISYAHIGGNVPIKDGYFPLYVTGGLGLTHLSPKDSLLNSETRFSMNIGLASKIPLSDHFSVRFGGRIYATFFNSDSKIFCDSENCAIAISSDLWIQSEVNAGITYTF